MRLLLGGVGAALLAEADDGGDEAAVVLDPLVGAAAGLLLLVLLGDLGRLAAHLPGTGQRSVHLTHVDGGGEAVERRRRRVGGRVRKGLLRRSEEHTSELQSR